MAGRAPAQASAWVSEGPIDAIDRRINPRPRMFLLINRTEPVGSIGETYAGCHSGPVRGGGCRAAAINGEGSVLFVLSAELAVLYRRRGRQHRSNDRGRAVLRSICPPLLL